jgi:ribonuclease VapC
VTASSGPDVIDASALLALLQDEPGAEDVRLADALMSSVNLSEVLHKTLEKGASTEGLRVELSLLGLDVVPFDAQHAETTAQLRARTRHLGLSLADRACLALAMERGGTAVTADRTWASLRDGVRVRVIR